MTPPPTHCDCVCGFSVQNDNAFSISVTWLDCYGTSFSGTAGANSTFVVPCGDPPSSYIRYGSVVAVGATSITYGSCITAPTPTPTNTPTNTITPTKTPTVTPTNTITPTLTQTVTPTQTSTPTPTPATAYYYIADRYYCSGGVWTFAETTCITNSYFISSSYWGYYFVDPLTGYIFSITNTKDNGSGCYVTNINPSNGYFTVCDDACSF